jgi:Transposase DDE domain group 1
MSCCIPRGHNLHPARW